MTALALIAAGFDPTVIVGTRLKEFASPVEALREGGGNNFRVGKSNLLVIEACEYDSSFEQYFPKITVVTNVDKEHLDYFKTFGNVIKEFKTFIAKLPPDGFLVFNNDDMNLRKISKGKFSALPYSLRNKETAILKKILQIPGKHNISNALAVLKVARILGVKDEITFKSLSEYKGSWRRFEIVKNNPYVVISDYGHHPTEIAATLKAAREKYPTQKIWCIFQPHQYQRTYYLFNDFVKVLRQAKIDNIIITDIYDVAGREEQTINKKINSQKLVKTIVPIAEQSRIRDGKAIGTKKHIKYMPMSDAETFVKEHIGNGDVLIIMGAGDIYKLADKF